MDVKEAVKTAAGYVAELETLAGDVPDAGTEQTLRDIRFAVEGTYFDDAGQCWKIKVGFARKWNQASSSPLAGLSVALKDNRTFKTVTIDDKTGQVISYGE